MKFQSNLLHTLLLPRFSSSRDYSQVNSERKTISNQTWKFPRSCLEIKLTVCLLITKSNENNIYIYYRHDFLTEKYISHKIHTKLHLGLERRIFHILTSEDIDDFSDIKFVS